MSKVTILSFIVLVALSSRTFSCESNDKSIATYEEVKDLPNHPDVLLIDVREPDELKETGQIPTSINIPLSIVESTLKDDLDAVKFKLLYGRDFPRKDQEIIFSCRSGKRAQVALEKACGLGFKNEVVTALSFETNNEGFQKKYGRMKPENSTPMVFYCKIGRRSHDASESARLLGYRNVKNYKGSWLDWAEHEGLPK